MTQAELLEEIKTAMRAKDSVKLNTLRALKTAIKNVEIDQKIEVGSAEIITIIRKQIKQRQDATEQYLKAERQELADKELAEIELLNVYLPAALSDEELDSFIQQGLTETGASSPKDMGKLIQWLKAKTDGRADGKTLATKVKEALNNL